MENNIEQAKKWFKDLFQGCYTKKLDKYPDSIFWIYDKNLIRQRKMAKITGIEKINLKMSDGELIFDQDVKNGEFWIKYSNYWSFLESNFNLNHQQVKELTNSVVNEVLNCKQYTTFMLYTTIGVTVNEVLNCKQYTTQKAMFKKNIMVNEILNCKQYTTYVEYDGFYFEVNEVLNCKQYTTDYEIFCPPEEENK